MTFFLLGDLVALFDEDDIDEVKQEEMKAFSRTLDPQQYLEFTECRQANFNKKAGKFKEWLDCTSLIDMKPNTPVMDVFSFLAYETVGQVVDLALLVKKDLEGSDVLTQAMPPVSILSESQSSVITPGSATSTPLPLTTPLLVPPPRPLHLFFKSYPKWSQYIWDFIYFTEFIFSIETQEQKKET
ncbi:Transcription initiation protein SPT3 [Desmophyllum pertusum]|uniref:Transcription initiation protein SPT3 n=1 Tax=Desmophyllum pertusum TaxID=174260 RepID=A0A9X0A100_9CNID|nr:Transcription initiation protein SPT3 [Desmophyllum pertusum]